MGKQIKCYHRETSCLGNQTVDEGKFFFTKIFQLKWRRNDKIYYSNRWIYGCRPWQPTAANITERETTRHYVSPDERTHHHLKFFQRVNLSLSKCLDPTPVCRKYRGQEHVKLHLEQNPGYGKLYKSSNPSSSAD